MSISQPSPYVTLTSAQLDAWALVCVPPPSGVQYGTIQMRGTSFYPTADDPLNVCDVTEPAAPTPANIVDAYSTNEEVD